MSHDSEKRLGGPGPATFGSVLRAGLVLGIVVGVGEALLTVIVPVVESLASGSEGSAYQGTSIILFVALLFGAVGGAISGLVIAALVAFLFGLVRRVIPLMAAAMISALFAAVLAGFATYALVRVVNVDLFVWPYVLASVLAAIVGTYLALVRRRRRSAL